MVNLMNVKNILPGVVPTALLAPVDWFTSSGIKMPTVYETVITQTHQFKSHTGLPKKKMTMKLKQLGIKDFKS
jgi:hypothetical protein